MNDLVSPASPRKAAPRGVSRGGGNAPPKILKAAAEEFGRHGFDGASVASIAKRAGVVKHLVHYHFQTKDLLWYATVRHAMSELQLQLSRLPFELRGIDPVEAFKVIVRKYAYFCATNPWVARMVLAEIMRDTPRSQWVVTEYQEPAYQMFEGVHQILAASGRFRQVPPRHLLPIINGSINAFAADGAVLKKRYGIDNTDPAVIEQHAEVLLELLLHGLLLPARPPGP